ncbi:tRNA 2-thiocytidine biosynthesis TtcA family protein [Candidatus Stoquefichus sp. SB1]|uniref:tRNA 2-thiocytidine biosynthesis TtcA family protein n=1 Tax=Candidatus Stoquefichus sp. SB1 TaxID=1658109 RepID=UPI00067EB3D4|nr:ATP-binding protein [Candidatus Stoquefichus sp. SB1]
MDRTKTIEQSIIKKYRKQIWRKFVKGVQTYDLIQPGDKIAVCISGGKDSMLMAKLLQELKRHGKFDFGLVFLSMDPGYNEKNRQKIEENARILNIPVEFFESDIFQVVANIEKSPCYLCARMRRGFLYAKAKELGCNKIALGHHFDDVIETILMGMFYGSQVQTMMPKLHSTNFEGMELIRPMYLIEEKDIIHWCQYNDLTFIQCACRFTEEMEELGEVQHTSKREEMKNLLKYLETMNPNVKKNVFKSVENVNLATIIAYSDDEGSHHFLDHYDKGEE